MHNAFSPVHASHLQVQPQYSRRDAWNDLANKEGLSYEVLELSLPPALTESRRFELCRNWYRDSGRSVSLHGAFIDVNPAGSDAALCAESRRRCQQSCELARFLGAQNVVFHSSCFPFLRGEYLERWADICAAFYEELADTWNLNILIENSQDLDAAPLQALMRRTLDPRIGVCLDIGHANYSRMPLEQWFDCLGETIRYLHLSDNHGMFDDHLPLGAGTVDWETADAFWRRTGKEMPVTLEVGGIDGVKASLAFLKEHGYFQKHEEGNGTNDI